MLELYDVHFRLTLNSENENLQCECVNLLQSMKQYNEAGKSCKLFYYL